MNDISNKKDKKSSGINWKLIVYLIIFITALCLFGFYPPAKLALFHLASLLQNHGWYGPLLIVLIIGFIVVPFGLPHSVFEMVLAFLISPYIFAVSMSLTAKMLGCTVCYLITKYKLKDRVRTQLSEKKLSVGIQKFLEKQPFRFLVMIWVIAIPMSFKTYGLSMMDSIKYKRYILSAFIGSLPASFMEVHIYKQASSIAELFNNKNPTQSIFSTVMMGVSIALIIYIMCYTKKIMKQVEEQANYVEQENEIELPRVDNENPPTTKEEKRDIEDEFKITEIKIDDTNRV
jgi:Uncharacterized conserved protein